MNIKLVCILYVIAACYLNHAQETAQHHDLLHQEPQQTYQLCQAIPIWDTQQLYATYKHLTTAIKRIKKELTPSCENSLLPVRLADFTLNMLMNGALACDFIDDNQSLSPLLAALRLKLKEADQLDLFLQDYLHEMPDTLQASLADSFTIEEFMPSIKIFKTFSITHEKDGRPIQAIAFDEKQKKLISSSAIYTHIWDIRNTGKVKIQGA